MIDPAVDAARTLRGECCGRCVYRFYVQDYVDHDNGSREPVAWLTCQRTEIITADRLKGEKDSHDWCRHYRRGIARSR